MMAPIRIMGDRKLGTEGVVVCSGLVGRPTRRCLWRIVAKRKHGADALRLASRLPPDEGSAVIHLDAAGLVIVNRKGEVLQDNRR